MFFHDDVIKWKHFPRYRWIPLTMTNGAELWRFLWSAPEQIVEQTTKAGDLRRHCAHCDVTVMFMANKSS